MEAAIKFSQDVVPIGDLKVNPGKVVRRTQETKRPVLLTSRGKGVAVVQSLEEYEAAQEERAFIKSISQGMSDLEAGRTMTLDELDQRLGLA